MGFSLDYFLQYFPKVLQGLPVTLIITLLSGIIGTLFGVLIAIIRIEKVPFLSQVSAIVVSFLRGTSVYIQLFIAYFGIPVIIQTLGISDFRMSNMVAVYITYGLNVGAYLSENFIAAFESVPKVQTEAALSVGLTKSRIYKNIIIPQAIRIALPNYGNTIINLMQDTSLAFSIGVVDMVGRVKSFQSVYFRSFEGYIAAAILYVICSYILEFVFKLIEKKISFTNAK